MSFKMSLQEGVLQLHTLSVFLWGSSGILCENGPVGASLSLEPRPKQPLLPHVL